jgi:hypothetical protein
VFPTGSFPGGRESSASLHERSSIISYPSTKMKHAACCAWEGSRLAGKWADFGIDRYRIEIASFVIR